MLNLIQLYSIILENVFKLQTITLPHVCWVQLAKTKGLMVFLRKFENESRNELKKKLFSVRYKPALKNIQRLDVLDITTRDILLSLFSRNQRR